ncbi:SDR family oxidoreductase [Novilysobacter avium]|uniref:SDR family oxidoreductase n=1 Tax=Novilysobacter avium TaxID=2781023 RepID=A0A7S6UIR2_9GAMM|nr:SDR family oxidoreductase [Lysobacter avium]QOW20995.1 SDR family oxidoreductase [Lysobacter avium]
MATSSSSGTGKKATGPAKKAARAADHQKDLQKAIEKKSSVPKAKKPASEKPRAVQAGTRKQPVRMPAQHIDKPGNEHELQLQPRYDAPDYKGSGKLAGMKAIITGGDSGIGRAVAVLFAREGADVAVVYLSEHKDAKATKAAVEAEGRNCVLISGDVKDPAFCKRAVARSVKALGGVDVLVNNAAFQLHADDLENLSEEHLQETLQTNIGGYFRMAKAALPHLKKGSSIINTGSETGIFGHKSLLDYSATKGAIHAFTQSLASNLLERGIRVNAVAPGPVWTPLNPADKPADEVGEFGRDSDMKRAAQPEELSPAYVFLASPVTASYISGIVLPVMGGPRG